MTYAMSNALINVSVNTILIDSEVCCYFVLNIVIPVYGTIEIICFNKYSIAINT
jgi:hypothetical protein